MMEQGRLFSKLKELILRIDKYGWDFAVMLYETLTEKLFIQFSDTGMRVQCARIDIATEPDPGRWPTKLLMN